MNRALLGGLALAAAQPAAADTLDDAVRSAVASNPQLAAARERQDAVAEGLEQARAAGRPTADARVDAGYDRFGYAGGGGGTITASLPIWTGGRVGSAVAAARGDEAAGQEGLRNTEAQVIFEVVDAYVGVLLIQQAVDISKADILLLDSQVAEAKARFVLGTGTQTDVARLVAQRASAAATQASNEADLAAAAAGLRAVTGREAGDLAAPGFPAALPATLEEARERALSSNPDLRQAMAARTAATARIGAARANGAPSVGLGASYGYDLPLSRSGGGYVQSASAGVTFRLPLLTGGLVRSQVRQAQATDRAAGFDVDAAAREVTRATDSAWAGVPGARRRIEANADAFAAAEKALAGVKAEYAVGLRSTLDIPIADYSLRNAQLALARSKSDLLTGEAALLRVTGALNASSFASPV